MKTVSEALSNKLTGLYFGNRVLLPFHGYILKIVIDNEIYTDFSPVSDDISISETEAYTEIYFLREQDLAEIVTKYESIKLLIVEKDKDVFNKEDHLKLALRLSEGHLISIKKTDEDILFIE